LSKYSLHVGLTITRVSETIAKKPLAEAQTALGTPVSVPLIIIIIIIIINYLMWIEVGR